MGAFSLTLTLYIIAAALTLLGGRARHEPLLSFLGGLLWAAGTVAAIVEGADMEAPLCAALALLLLSGVQRKGRADG